MTLPSIMVPERALRRRHPGRDELRVLVFTTVFPHSSAPLHGLFVYERNRHLAKHATLVTVAPVAWYQRLGPRIQAHEPHKGLRVAHPIFFYLPRFMKILDGCFLFISTLATVRRLHRKFKFHLIDAHFAYPDGFAAVLLGRVLKVPVVLTLHGTEILLLPFRMRSALADWTICSANRVIAVAENLTARALKARLAPSRLTLIPNGVNAVRFAPVDRLTARNRVGTPANGLLMVSVGHVSPRKGFQRVIRILPLLTAQYPTLTFAIVGGAGAEGDVRPKLQRLAHELGVAHRVRFVGACSPDGVASWLCAADLFVVASDFEGSPNVVWEAMACGRPVVATRVGHVEHMVPPFAGILFDDPEHSGQLLEAVCCALERSWNAERIRAHAVAHAWDRVAGRILNEWRRTVDEEPARADHRFEEDALRDPSIRRLLSDRKAMTDALARAVPSAQTPVKNSIPWDPSS
jgi:teichuronic acid biosynthesis glycosyltransferase TuaC